MRDLVTKTSFHIRKGLDEILYFMLPSQWIPLYNSVSFTHMPYRDCQRNREWQNKVYIYSTLLKLIFKWHAIFTQILNRIFLGTAIVLLGGVAVAGLTGVPIVAREFWNNKFAAMSPNLLDFIFK